jgi:predicted dehydrogenase
VLVFNGEIYNHRQLRSELQALGAEFHTTSDTEVVLREDGREPERIALAPVDTLRAELEAFAAAAGGGPAYPLPPDQAIATVACFEAIVASVAAGGAATLVEG